MTARHEINGTAVTVLRGDITRQDVDAIVNAANEYLVHGGGVAAAIAHAGAPDVQEESDRWVDEHGPLGPGAAAVTSAGSMPARWVIHVVGPRFRPDQDNVGLLAGAVDAALDAAAGAGAASVALPAISAGIFGYPQAEATEVIVAAAADWAARHPGTLTEIRLIGFDASCTADFMAAIERL
jgi:putative ATPase